MSSGEKIIVGISVLLLGTIAAYYLHVAFRRKPITLQGAVITQDADPEKQLPLSNVLITAADDKAASSTTSDVSGLFHLTLRIAVRHGQPILLRFSRTGYFDYQLKDYVSDKLYVIRMTPRQKETRAQANRTDMRVGNALVKYSVKDTSSANIGSAVKTFVVQNTGNKPCDGKDPCSPDGKWKASEGSVTLDAGEGNTFQAVRASCIAGPCPFTRVDTEEHDQRQRTVKVSALDWSDTTMFLVEAEVVHPMVSNAVRESYPVIFGRALNFTLPADAEGISIQAELNGETIIFPLGPDLLMSWADCNTRAIGDGNARVYRCELKPGYTFR
ncbi:MAG TPA: hypothetical protein VGF44_16210 [Terriglobales bacterium]|jgi:hypothetical protein